MEIQAFPASPGTAQAANGNLGGDPEGSDARGFQQVQQEFLI